MNEKERFGWFLFKRLSGFALFLVILFLVLFNLFKTDFNTIEKEWGGASQAESGKGTEKKESMTQKNKNGGVSNKDQSKLAGSLNKDKELVFVAKLDNFLGDGKTPNPLYFTAFYYTKFDTTTQTFERDPNIPYNDLFRPDPSTIPLYFKKTDQQVVKNSLATRNRKVVSAEIYNVNLSPQEFLAPSTSFFCQPISVPKEQQKEYRSAYLAKMWVSDLNSAYFIYNPAGNEQLESFQQQRFELLREVNEIKGPDAAFMKYYTYMPRSTDYDKIAELSKQLTKGLNKPIDKILAIRDYFDSKDELDQPLFKYSDNPGIPGLPSANKLTYFLLENRKGYCAYFAGATLFMLRSLGIPSRVAVGYSTVDRSSKNPGWYWFYRDQAHAWVQVYFNEFGWIDFDTTIPDLNTQQAPQPDGTPPENIVQTFLVADGKIDSVDLTKKRVFLKVEKMLFHDTDYVTSPAKEMIEDVSLASIMSDTGAVALELVKKGMRATAVSHAEVLKNIHAKSGDSLIDIIKKIPNPVPVDELKIINKDPEKKDKTKDKLAEEKGIDWISLLWAILATLGCLILFLIFLPTFIWYYLHSKAKNEKENSAYFRYRALLFYLNQLGYGVGDALPAEYGRRMDALFGPGFSSFNVIYQKMKYSSVPLTEEERKILSGFYSPYIKSIKQKVSFKDRSFKFLNSLTTLYYFTKYKSS